MNRRAFLKKSAKVLGAACGGLGLTGGGGTAAAQSLKEILKSLDAPKNGVFGTTEIASLVAMLVQSEMFGTSISDALRTFANTMRERRSQRAEEAAERMAVKLLVPIRHEDLRGDFSWLRIMTHSAGDTTLVIRRPDQTMICNDDYEGLNPGVESAFPIGIYEVWVGSYDRNDRLAYRLGITELHSVSPNNLAP